MTNGAAKIAADRADHADAAGRTAVAALYAFSGLKITAAAPALTDVKNRTAWAASTDSNGLLIFAAWTEKRALPADTREAYVRAAAATLAVLAPANAAAAACAS